MKRFRRVLLGVFVIGVGAASWYGYALYKNVEETANAIYEPLSPVPAAQPQQPVRPQPSLQASETPAQSGETTKKQQENKPISILLFGVDKRGTDEGRSDTIIYLVSNPVLKQTLMFSIPRDTRTQIADIGREDKINHAYAFGGMSATVRTVESFLGTPVDYYVKVDMEGFLNIIDSLGGVVVDNARAVSYFFRGVGCCGKLEKLWLKFISRISYSRSTPQIEGKVGR